MKSTWNKSTLDKLSTSTIALILLVMLSKPSYQELEERPISKSTIFLDKDSDLNPSWNISGDSYAYIDSGAELSNFQLYLPTNFSPSSMVKETGLWVFYPDSHKAHRDKYILTFSYSNSSQSITYAGVRLSLGNNATLRIVTKHGEFSAFNEGTLWSHAKTRWNKKLATQVSYNIELYGADDYAIIDGFEVDVNPYTVGRGMSGKARAGQLSPDGDDDDYEDTDSPAEETDLDSSTTEDTSNNTTNKATIINLSVDSVILSICVTFGVILLLISYE